MSTLRLSRALAGTLLVVSSSLSIAPAYARDPSRAPQPGSFEAIMSVKDPAHYGPHMPAADIPSTYVAPVPGSWQAIMSVKDPAHYGPHLPAADAPLKIRCTLRPGSWEAIMSVKDPAHYGPCGRK